ncbi:SRPBCC domain-containing protein [Nakamurella lactea]|uniref:SRPBCC domain-containing protein n=1 Tax=Nakamurella lactea TaxID=459515 RepID=UPI00041F562D|nr:SRPBCC domain-containing protein [Nakamurella lactea]
MEYGVLERQLQIDASPEVVFEVVSQPEHLRHWWPDEVTLDPTPGGTGELVFGDRVHVAGFTVVDVDPPRRFSFRWVAPEGEVAAEGNSLLVTFELEPSGDGTLLKFSETGWREKGWEAAVLEEQFLDHERGWDIFLPRLQTYAPTVAGRVR